MENRSLVLFMILLVLGALLWGQWQRDYRVPPGLAQGETAPTAPGQEEGEALPALPREGSRQGWSSLRDHAPPPGAAEGMVIARTDVLELRISPVGGTVEKVSLLGYPVELDRPDEVITLGGDSFSLQSGVGGRDFWVSHQQRFVADRQEHVLADSEDELTVRLLWSDPGGGPAVSVEKLYRMRRGSYVVRLEHRVTNEGGEAVSAQAYAQMQRREGQGRGMLDASYTGLVWSSPSDPYAKLDFEELRERNMAQTIDEGWMAWLQHYFLAAVLPDRNCPCSYYTRYLDDGAYIAGSWSGARLLAPGEAASMSHRLYLGPKEQDRLRRAARNLELTVDFGWLFFISDILFKVLAWLHGLVGNWGVSIILLTVMVKTLFLPLTAISFRSMAHMRELQPKMEALKKRHGEDRAAMQKAMMQLYREEKINPMSGCLPILVQIPVFIALYWVLFESVELRQAGFALWIRDLSAPDPYFVLPLLMGLSMYAQQKLSPQSPDPLQRKIISFMPIPFTLFTVLFPSGLVLYWVVSNVLSILQQWFITRRFSGKG